jgi:3-deoxy-D-manno-octulosonic-acid transferase
MSSVGEVNLSEPLVNRFLSENKKVFITVVTDTGYELALKKYGDSLSVFYFPLDNIFVLRKILSNINLKKLILVETEIWPNLINEAYKHGSISIINGRISDKSFKSYKKIHYFLKNILNKITYFIMQTELDADRIIALGASKDRVFNFGNLKFNIQLQNYSDYELLEIKNRFGIKNEKIFVAGSTREGEEKLILEVFSKLKGYKLFIVPRHLNRIEEIEVELGDTSYTLWTEAKKNTDVILVDAMGELRRLYALSDIAFVGGTLVDVGGHSLLEPLFYMKFPIFGRFTQNVRDISTEIIKREIGYRVKSLDEFIEAIKKVEERIEDNKEIVKFFDENKKVCDKTFELLIDLL